LQLANPDRLAESSTEPRRQARQRIDLLRSRVGLLEGRDKALMEMYLGNGVSFRKMAAVAGVNEVTIARRIHKLIKRLLDGEYITCLRNRGRFTKFELDVARDYFLSGLSQRRIASKRRCSVYRVRLTLQKIDRLVRLAAHPGQTGGAKAFPRRRK